MDREDEKKARRLRIKKAVRFLGESSRNVLAISFTAEEEKRLIEIMENSSDAGVAQVLFGLEHTEQLYRKLQKLTEINVRHSKGILEVKSVVDRLFDGSERKDNEEG